MTTSTLPKTPPLGLYLYKAIIDRVVDGDTVVARVDLGFNTWRNDKFRFAHINAPEMKTAEGPVAKEFLAQWIVAQKSLTFYSKGQDKYGRWVAVIWGDDLTVSINQIMLDKGLAVPYM
jgi:endonuclease YncB( thermonuclease family)